MVNEAHREILWNVSSPLTYIVMYGLFALSLVVALAGIWRRVEVWHSGKADPDRSALLGRRIWSALTGAMFQRKVIRERTAAIFHTLVYFGFLVLLFTTTMVFIDHDLGIKIYHGEFYLWVTVMSDLFGLGLLIGCILAAQRRYIQRVQQLHSRAVDSLLLSLLALLVVQGFVLEGLRIHVTDDPWAHYSFIGNLFAQFFWPLSNDAARLLHKFTWWFHTVTVFAGFALVPYTKLFHIVGSSLNIFFSPSRRPAGALPFPGDLEKLMEQGDEFSIGLGSIKDYSWKNLMDLDACTSCGRCQDNCPAYLSGKPLSPKWVVLDTRNHALALAAANQLAPSKMPASLQKMDALLTTNILLKGSGVTAASDGGFNSAGAFRAQNPLVQSSVRKLGGALDARIAEDVIDPAVFWSCTTCMACVEACPVGINHVDQIVENRRNLTLMQGELPTEAQKTLRLLESQGNPYGPAEDRIKWIESLSVKVLKAGDEVDYLYWVGCVSAFDPRKQKIARALVTLMEKAGLNFGILGSAEGCTGDPARRLGEENLFQTLAKGNIETLKSIKFHTIVANCPHCFNTIKNEYPQLGNLGQGREPEIIHHSVLLQRLIAENKLTLNELDRDITFHDPCYLGRYNREFEAPRDTLKAAKGLRIIEMERSREKGMCCGAGGGHFWMDLKVGERVNVLRTEQAAATGADRIATACPFCMQMMEDGVKLTDREAQIDVRDIAEVVLEQVK